jgi:hypothetical protein
MCSVQFWQSTIINSLYSINLSIFLTGAHSILCEERTDFNFATEMGGGTVTLRPFGSELSQDKTEVNDM